MITQSLSRIRKLLNLTQKEMASILGITYVHISNIETGKTFPSFRLIDDFNQKFGINLYVYNWCLSDYVPISMHKIAKELVVKWEMLFKQKNI